MANSTSAAQKAAYLFLALCCVTLLAFGGFRAYQIYGPSKVSVGGVPYGLPAGSTVARGDAPDMKSETSSMPVQVQTEMRRAQELFRNGSFGSAFDIYDGIVLLYPDFAPAIWGAVNTLFEIDSLNDNQRDRLSLLSGKLQGRYPNSGLSSYIESRSLYLAGNTAAAQELARVASERAPALYETRLWYGELLLKESRTVQAATELKTVVSLSNGDSPKAYELLAELYHQSGMLDSCSAVVEYALSQYPVDAHLLLLQGYMNEYRGRYDAAEKIYQRILAFRPEYLPAREAVNTLGEKTPPGSGSGASVSPQDRAQVACDILEPLVERYPENLPLKEALGRAYLKGRQYDRARLQFQEIQRNNPEYPEIQQRIQEANVTRAAPASKGNNGLAANLSRAVDSLREASKPTSSHDFTTMLGHYLVRYGATPKEFFKKYSISNFKPVRNNVWQESFYNAPYKHTYTVVFDSLNHFRQVHVVVYDSSSSSNHLGMAPEVFNRLLKQNSRISGIGNSTGETDCGDGLVLDAAVWETQDNFEMIARVVGKPAEVRMIRFDKTVMPPGLKLCDYITYLNQF
ncbi:MULTISPECIES: tetratricopeptide repeat protein [unclassified Fibrobacter]|uniref:tetratricopeptide repeat protein n=1 Tax=unclassified Fibrobacter TaxID=2634177 RepID=UPI000D6AAE00|nr:MULTISPECIES: tetratricopeptide repeat protein [unclassified Fibrobacter]PWJ66214.1 tetratricopeptide (TPR) repeat protein [Fibrobacter sp. UWR4]PZW69418.1 tetratricopeptide (TPR) repeat protein [Fibrobacter sp. UWR1]